MCVETDSVVLSSFVRISFSISVVELDYKMKWSNPVGLPSHCVMLWGWGGRLCLSRAPGPDSAPELSVAGNKRNGKERHVEKTINKLLICQFFSFLLLGEIIFMPYIFYLTFTFLGILHLIFWHINNFPEFMCREIDLFTL